MKRFVFSPYLLSTILVATFFATGLLCSSPAAAYYSRSMPGGDTLLDDEEHYIEMRGVVMESKGSDKEEKKTLDSAQITVSDEQGKVLLQRLSDRKGRCNFRLSLNQLYNIAVTRRGYVNKIIQIDTEVPHDKLDVYVFNFDVDIFEQVKGLDVSVLQKPIAKVSYSIYQKAFIYDIAYTSKVNMDLKKMYRQYYTLEQASKKAAADSIATAKIH